MSEFAATVVEIHGMKATVLPLEGGERVRCRPLRDRRQLAVGDRVTVTSGKHGPVVSELTERTRCLWRPVERGRRLMAAHVDRVCVVVSVSPPPRAGLIDRFLVAAEAAGIDVTLVLNKTDIADGLVEAEAELRAYEALGYQILRTSAESGEGLEALSAHVADGFSVFAGHSGVGKSSLLNQLVPGLDLGVGETNEMTGKGRHTTSVTTCHEIGGPWPDGALLADTPGVRAFGLYGMPLTEIALGFRDLAPHRANCKFRDCLHESEPDCAVRAAVESGDVAAARVEGYTRILASVRAGDG
ncbi:MAG: ribosome small subunit-dependent GTPase A [Myxococcota bacterium]